MLITSTKTTYVRTVALNSFEVGMALSSMWPSYYPLPMGGGGAVKNVAGTGTSHEKQLTSDANVSRLKNTWYLVSICRCMCIHECDYSICRSKQPGCFWSEKKVCIIPARSEKKGGLYISYLVHLFHVCVRTVIIIIL